MSSTKTATLLGVNLPWFDGAYGHDLSVNALHPDWGRSFKTMKAYQPMVEASDLGFRAVRIWLCEKGEGIVWENGLPAAPHPHLLEAVDVLQEAANLLGLRVYWSLLDGNSPLREDDALTRRVVEDPEARARFASQVAAPLAKRFDPALTYAVEVLNEPEMMTSETSKPGQDPVAWEPIGATVREVRAAVRAHLGNTPVTCGVMTPYQRSFLASDPGVDLVDVHVYHHQGGLPTLEQLAGYANEPRIASGELAVIAGECGIPDDASDDDQELLTNFLFNAGDSGFAAAFLWRLEQHLVDIKRPGPAPGKRPLTDVGRKVREALRQLASR